ncbi:MAG: EamA family transporter [Candidatus Omnitrophica bacterium]|nr:EamA family transporter [Candidatus Omnitrophota bacterium]
MFTVVKVVVLVILSEVWNVIAHILFKKSANTVDMTGIRGLSGHVDYLKKLLSDKLIWIGFGFQVLCVATWLVALAQADLSFVFPLGSIQYIFILFSAHIFLGEKIDRMKLTGTLMVVAGIILITMS